MSSLITAKIDSGERPDFHYRVGFRVLKEFLDKEEDLSRYGPARELVKRHAELIGSSGGAELRNRNDIQSGQLPDPDSFFNSRSSLRDFVQNPVSDEIIRRAVTLASRSPSVCNRQSWKVHKTSDRETIRAALSLQNGNQGFTDRIPTLLLLTVDLNAFDTSFERYQHWIDGGMFAMSLVWAFHALGIGTCCLNWSKGAMDDMKIRRVVSIPRSESITMMLAVGHIPENTKVCVSARHGPEEIIRELDLQ